MRDTVCESSENVNLILCSKLGDVTQEDLRNVSRAGIIYTSEVELAVSSWPGLLPVCVAILLQAWACPLPRGTLLPLLRVRLT